MNNDAQKHLNDMMVRWTAQQNAALGGIGYGNTSQPSPHVAKALSGLSALFNMLGNVKDSRPAVKRILTLAAEVDIARYEERVDAEHWRVIRDELCEMADWYAAHKDADFINDGNHRPYDEREAYLKHMLTGFSNGDRFIVAKLSFDGGAA